MAEKKRETVLITDDSRVVGYRCSEHPRYLGKRDPRVNCWACWVIRLRQLGWIVESKAEKKKTGPGRLEC